MPDLLQCVETGIPLTERLAIELAASGSGFYRAHLQSQYFDVVREWHDQVQDIAAWRSAVWRWWKCSVGWVPICDVFRIKGARLELN